jgi:mannose/fructose-specific phosphotransferase system component IIA
MDLAVLEPLLPESNGAGGLILTDLYGGATVRLGRATRK